MKERNKQVLTIRRRATVLHPIRRLRVVMSRQRGIAAPGDTPLTADEILRRVGQLPVSTWTYGFDHASVRHMGPMAQDFAAAFGLGTTNRRIDLLDANGVLFVAVQALYRRMVDLEREVAALRGRD